MWGGNSNPKFRHVLIIGVGLIGGSIGMALKQRGIAECVWGVDREPEIIDQAYRRGAVDGGSTDIAGVAEKADLVILAVPVKKCVSLARQIIPHLKDGCLITDVASTKQEVVSAVEGIIPEGIHFIGGHPMAGSEKAGISAADPRLLENAIYILTPTENSNPEALAKLRGFVESLGSYVLLLSPGEHDRLVGLVSHLPHITAVALVGAIQESPEDRDKIIALAAGGFCDTTRIAMSNPVIWKDICLTNRDAIIGTIRSFKQELDKLEDLISRGNAGALYNYFARARDFRCRISPCGKGILPEVFELVVLEENPGVIGAIASLLGEAHINFDEIEIQHVRGPSGGSIRLGFRSKSDRERAMQLLRQKGFSIINVD